MKKLLLLLCLTFVACTPTDPEVAVWQSMADEITITRDDWGIAHVYGPTDAHAVFGAIFAQAEDDFNRIERNFLFSQGRLAEAFGEDEVWGDLRMKLFIDPVEMMTPMMMRPSDTSYEIICAADRSEPRNGYLELEAQPPMITP